MAVTVHFFVHLDDPEGYVVASTQDLDRTSPSLVRIETRELEVSLPDDLNQRLQAAVQERLDRIDMEANSHRATERHLLHNRLAVLRQEALCEPC